MRCSPEEIEALVLYQIGALDGVARAEGARVSHVKPHGALSNDSFADSDLARAIARAGGRYRGDELGRRGRPGAFFDRAGLAGSRDTRHGFRAWRVHGGF